MKVYGVVLIGCGHIGEQHIEEIYYRDNIRIIGVVDKDPKNAELFAKKYGAKQWSTEYRELVYSDEVDIVIIASWVKSHVEILKACIDAGKHILCEKPIASNKAEADEAFRMIENADVKVQIAMILRHNQTYRRVKQLIDDGAIGELRLIRMSQNHHTMNWDRYKALLEDCPSFFDCGVHYYDIISWLADSPISSVHGTGMFLDDCSNENYGIVELKTESGCLGVYEAGWSNQIPAEDKKLFVGSEGYISLVLSLNRLEDREEGDLIKIYSSKTKEYKTINLQSQYKNMYGQLSALIKSIETGCETVPSLAEAKRSTNVAFAVIESVRNQGKNILV